MKTLHDKVTKDTGAYEIIDPITNKRYVGSTDDLERRRGVHAKSLENGRLGILNDKGELLQHDNINLQNLYNSNQELLFTKIITEDREQAYDIEQYMLDSYKEANLLLNIAIDARASGTGRVMSEEAKQRIADANRGRVPSDETREKLREASTGHKRNLGKIRTPEQKEKISQTLKGRVFSEETRARISAALKGRTKTEEHKLNLSNSKKGSILSDETKIKISNAFKGRVLSEEHKTKISNSHLGICASEETRLKISEAKKGKKYSDETKTNMSIGQLQRWKTIKDTK